MINIGQNEMDWLEYFGFVDDFISNKDSYIDEIRQEIINEYSSIAFYKYLSHGSVKQEDLEDHVINTLEKNMFWKCTCQNSKYINANDEINYRKWMARHIVFNHHDIILN